MLKILGWIHPNKTRFMIEENENGIFRVFIGGVYRISKKTLRGAKGVVSKTGTIEIEREIVL